jgi:hypothetical protein
MVCGGRVIKAAMNEQECGPEVAKRYRVLPTDPHIKEEVTDMCSEYGENTPICSQPKTHSSGFWFMALLIFLLMIELIYLFTTPMIQYFALICD